MLNDGGLFSFQTELPWKNFPVFLLTVFSTLRLAKFNLDTRQSTTFLGLPTPACAIFVTGLSLIHYYDLFGLGLLTGHPLFIYSCLIALCWLLVSEVPMFSLKFKRFTWEGNEIKFIFAALAVLAAIGFGFAAPALVIGLYIFYNVFNWIKRKPAS